MVTNRDVSVLYARCRAKKGWRVLDGLGGTGARGVRLAVETDLDLNIHINDRSTEAFEVISKNIEMNNLEGITATQLELFSLLPTEKFDWIDIDPYGSPVNYVDPAVQRLSKGGTLSVTATDTAPLCGTYVKACKRRYMARPMNSSCKHETGLRILVGNIIRRVAVMEIALTPELAYYQGHYFRCYFSAEKGAKPADRQLEKIGYLELKGGEYSIRTDLPKGKRWAGPLWLGDLMKKRLVKRMLAAVDKAMSKDTVHLLECLEEELLQPPYHYHTDDLAKLLKMEPLKTRKAVEILCEKGSKASLVHYTTKGYRTEADFDKMKTLFSGRK